MTNTKMWTPTEIGTFKIMWLNGDTAQAIGDHLGRSKNSVIGKIGRLGLHRTKTEQAEIDARRSKARANPEHINDQVGKGNARGKPCEIVIQEILDESYPTETSHHPEMSLIMAGALIDTIETKQIASASGRSLALAKKVHAAMIAGGIWGKDAGDITRYDGDEGWMQIILEAMMTRGEIVHHQGSWAIPKRAAQTPT